MFVLQLQDLKKGTFLNYVWHDTSHGLHELWNLLKYMLKRKTFQGCDKVYDITLKKLP